MSEGTLKPNCPTLPPPSRLQQSNSRRVATVATRHILTKEREVSVSDPREILAAAAAVIEHVRQYRETEITASLPWKVYLETLHKFGVHTGTGSAVEGPDSTPLAPEHAAAHITLCAALLDLAQHFQVWVPEFHGQRKRVKDLLGRASRDLPEPSSKPDAWIWQCRDTLTRFESHQGNRALILAMLTGNEHNQEEAQRVWSNLPPLCCVLINLVIAIDQVKEKTGFAAGS